MFIVLSIGLFLNLNSSSREMLSGKKFAVFALLTAVYFGYRLSQVYVPEQFEGKGAYRIMYGIIRVTGIIVGQLKKKNF